MSIGPIQGIQVFQSQFSTVTDFQGVEEIFKRSVPNLFENGKEACELELSRLQTSLQENNSCFSEVKELYFRVFLSSFSREVIINFLDLDNWESQGNTNEAKNRIINFVKNK